MSRPGRVTNMVRAAVGGCLAIVLAGCGSDTPPADSVPELRTRLSGVDRAIAEHKFGQARRQIQRLVRTAVHARDGGDLAAGEAEPILAAAASLVSALPQQPNRPEPRSPQPQPAPDKGDPAASNQDSADRAEEQEKRQEELEKKREELQKKLEEERKKEEGEGGGEEGGGNGHSSENGPDDGHGN